MNDEILSINLHASKNITFEADTSHLAFKLPHYIGNYFRPGENAYPKISDTNLRCLFMTPTFSEITQNNNTQNALFQPKLPPLY